MTKQAIAVTLIASLISGLVGVFVSFKFYERLEIRMVKFETAKKLSGGRYDMDSVEFNTAMNEIFIVYADSKEVMTAMKEFWEVLQIPREHRSNGLADDKFLILLKAISKDSGISHPDNLNDAYFLRTFSSSKTSGKGNGT